MGHRVRIAVSGRLVKTIIEVGTFANANAFGMAMPTLLASSSVPTAPFFVSSELKRDIIEWRDSRVCTGSCSCSRIVGNAPVFVSCPSRSGGAA